MPRLTVSRNIHIEFYEILDDNEDRCTLIGIQTPIPFLATLHRLLGYLEGVGAPASMVSAVKEVITLIMQEHRFPPNPSS